METKIKRLLGLGVVMLAMFAPLTGCITEEPVIESYLLDLEITPEQISTLLGLPLEDVETAINDLNAEFYGTYIHNASYVYEDYSSKYDGWYEHYNTVIMETEQLTIYAGAWRQLVGVNTVVVAEGTYVFDETGYPTVIMLTHGEVMQYTDLMEDF